MSSSEFSQHPYRCRLDWGRHGASAAAARGDIVAIVDVLSFSTAVATAVHRSALIYPCAQSADAQALALRVGGEAAVNRRQVPALGRFSLSPLTYLGIEPDIRVVLPSLNGATCLQHARQAPYIFVGALVNAQSVASAISRLLNETYLCATIIACGERWSSPTDDGSLRVAVEDYLGADAIISSMTHDKSAEARAAEGAFRHCADSLDNVLWDCASGRELREQGFAGDVHHSARLNLYDTVPVLLNDCLVRLDQTIGSR